MQITFKVCEDVLKKELIGEISYNFEDLLENIQKKNFKIINLQVEPRDFCILPNGQLLITSIASNNLTIYDSKFQLVKTIDKINSTLLYPLSVITNHKNYVYIAQETCEIIQTDLDFNFINSFGSYGSSENQFEIVSKLFHYENSIYVCDSHNCRIQELSEDLAFQESYKLKFKPWKVIINKNVLCVRPVAETIVYLYNLKPFYFKTKIFHLIGDIFTLNSWFYFFNHDRKEINCYDINGVIVEDSKLKVETNIINQSWDIIHYFNHQLIIGFTQEKKIILF